MGICVQGIEKEDGPNFLEMEKNLHTEWGWLVLWRDPVPRPNTDDKVYDYHILGLASNEASAVEMCFDENCMIGPLPVDSALPKHRMEWPGLYFPLRP